MILRLKHTLLALAALLATALTGCINDDISTSADDQPTFSTDTVRLGTLFTQGPSPTHRFTVYNRSDKGINISHISFADDPNSIFRINVDGISGREFSNVEIRENDSIFVFVEATLPENGSNATVDVLAHIEFLTNGVTRRMPVKAYGRDVCRLKGDTRYASDMTLSTELPYQITDSLVVEEGARLTIPAGAELFFHDDARIVVHGSLSIEGTAEAPVSLTGDRFGYVAAKIPYEIMSGQWRGIEFTSTSTDNRIAFASIRNSANGLTLDRCPYSDATPALTIVNSQVRNTKGYVLQALHSSVVAAGCEFSDASMGIVGLVGGRHSFASCTFANYYLFTAIGGPAVWLDHLSADKTTLEGDDAALPYMQAEFTNSIIYGLGTELNHGDLKGTQVRLRRCLLKSAGSNDDEFTDCIWDTDPMYFTVREDYHFDYRLRPASPAIDAGFADLLSPLSTEDRYGTPRHSTPSLGAYEVAAE